MLNDIKLAYPFKLAYPVEDSTRACSHHQTSKTRKRVDIEMCVCVCARVYACKCKCADIRTHTQKEERGGGKRPSSMANKFNYGIAKFEVVTAEEDE